METFAFILWIVINGIIGVLIGEKKGDLALSLLLCLLFGPIGWVISLLLPDHTRRKCPFCAEAIKIAAILCPHCRSHLKKPTSPTPTSTPPPAKLTRAEEPYRI